MLIGEYPHISCLQSASPLSITTPLTTTAPQITSESMPRSFWWVFHSTYSPLSFLDDLNFCEAVFPKVTDILRCPFPCSQSGSFVHSSTGSCASGSYNSCSQWQWTPFIVSRRKEIAKCLTSVRLPVMVMHTSSLNVTETWGHRMDKLVEWPCGGHA